MDRSGRRADGQPFEEEVVEAVWRKAAPYPGQADLRLDACGALMNRSDHGRTDVLWGWEIDHIRPVAKGGTDDMDNLQPLQWRNNRHKGDDWPDWECGAW